MMQQAMIVGRLGSDPIAKTTDNNIPFASVSVGVSKRRGGQDETTWWNLTVFGKLGENFLQHAKKGMLCCACGEFSLESFRARDGSVQTRPGMRPSQISWTQTQASSPKPVTPQYTTKAQEDSEIPF